MYFIFISVIFIQIQLFPTANLVDVDAFRRRYRIEFEYVGEALNSVDKFIFLSCYKVFGSKIFSFPLFPIGSPCDGLRIKCPKIIRKDELNCVVRFSKR